MEKIWKKCLTKKVRFITIILDFCEKTLHHYHMKGFCVFFPNFRDILKMCVTLSCCNNYILQFSCYTTDGSQRARNSRSNPGSGCETDGAGASEEKTWTGDNFSLIVLCAHSFQISSCRFFWVFFIYKHLSNGPLPQHLLKEQGNTEQDIEGKVELRMKKGEEEEKTFTELLNQTEANMQVILYT